MFDRTLQTLEEKIKQRRAQMLVHSYLYYILADTIVDDHTWQRWANELVILQKEFNSQKKKKKINFYDRDFKDWDGSTGFDLHFDARTRAKAHLLLEYEKRSLSVETD